MEEVRNVTNGEAPGQPQVTGEGGQQVFSPESLVILSKTAFWLKMMSIAYYVMAGLLAGILGILAGIGSHNTMQSIPGMTGLKITSILMQLAGVFLLALMGRYLQSTSKGYREFTLDQHNIHSLEVALSNQRLYWRLQGIIFLIVLSGLVISMLLFILGDAMH
jgi:hypothetical protein